jgi:transcription elongation factor GreA
MDNTGDNKHYLTSQKKKDLEKELDELKNKKRKEVAVALDEARHLGDLSENAEYQEARENQAMVEYQISQIETILKDAVIVKSHKSDVVEIGTTVTIRKKSAKTTQVYQIVGSQESSMKDGKISNTSPLAQAMLEKTKGDDFTFVAPNGMEMHYTIVDIS